LSEFYPYPSLFLGFTKNDRHYLLNWLFKFPANPDPTQNGAPDFLTNGVIDYSKVAAFKADTLAYKLFNHYQVKFRVDPDGGAFDLFNGPVMQIWQDTTAGVTQDVIVGWLHPPQMGPNDGVTRSTTSMIGLINDASPEATGVNVFSELMGDNRNPDTAVFWENIGSRITFTPTSTQPTLTLQNYPTYYWYANGNAPAIALTQALEPSGHFFPSAPLAAYPFGDNPSNGAGTDWGLFGNPVPGGRNGDATSPADATSRIPPYVAA
jgi:hypothetical protein